MRAARSSSRLGAVLHWDHASWDQATPLRPGPPGPGAPQDLAPPAGTMQPPWDQAPPLSPLTESQTPVKI